MAGNVLHPTVRWVKENEGTVQTTVAENGAVSFSITCQSDKKSPEILLNFGRKECGIMTVDPSTALSMTPSGCHRRIWRE